MTSKIIPSSKQNVLFIYFLIIYVILIYLKKKCRFILIESDSIVFDCLLFQNSRGSFSTPLWLNLKINK